MINNVDDFKKELISSGIAEGEYQFVGCTAEQLTDLESKYGSFPTSYKQIMRAIGRRAGRLIHRGEYDFYIDEISNINEEFIEIQREGLEELGYPTNVFIIYFRQGTTHFLLTDAGDDSPVFISTDIEVKQIYSSVWEWLESFAIEAKYFLELEANQPEYLKYWVPRF